MEGNQPAPLMSSSDKGITFSYSYFTLIYEILTYIVSKGPLLWQMHGHGVSTTAPASHGHSAVTYKNCLYIYGGDVKDNKRISDVHKHSLGKKTEQKK